MDIENSILKFGLVFKKQYLKLITGLIIIISLFIISSIMLSKEIQNDLSDKFKRITFNEEISGTVKKKFNNRGTVYIEFLDSSKYSILDVKNDIYKPNYLDDFIKKNDLIFKKKDSDTLFVKRDTNIYYFILKAMPVTTK